MKQLRTNVFWETKDKPNKPVLEQLKFSYDIVRGGNDRKRAVFKDWSDALFIDLNQGGWAKSPLFVGVGDSKFCLQSRYDVPTRVLSCDEDSNQSDRQRGLYTIFKLNFLTAICDINSHLQ